MNNNPLVSIAIITYNQKAFLQEAIESVLLQDYRPLQIVIGDDFSTDGTKELMLDYQNKYPELFVLKFSLKNQGNTANANNVHFACTGKYIAWLGGDDLMLPYKLSQQVAFLEANQDYNIVYHNLDVFNSVDNKHLRYYNSEKDKHTGDVRKLIKYGTFNGACGTMLRRSASPPHGHYPELLISADWLYWIEHLIPEGKIGYIDKVLAKYRKHENNVSNPNGVYMQQAEKDVTRSLEILLEKYPEYKREIFFRASEIYRGRRIYNYKSNLRKSLKYNPLNLFSWIIYTAYLFSFGKIKL